MTISPHRNLLIVGAGGQGKVVADTAAALNTWHAIAFVDDRFPEHTQTEQWPVVGKINDAQHLREKFSEAVIAVGNNAQRMVLLEQLKNWGFEFPVLVHPTAFVSPFAQIAEGTVVFPKAVVEIEATVGRGAIINSGAVVAHDCRIADGVHVAPTASLAGGTVVEKCVWIGAGANVLHHVTIGEHAIVGGGAVVLKDVAEHSTVAGVPAKEISSKG